MTEDDLTALFRRLGARDPEEWAASQLREGIPQLARFLFLKSAWEGVVADGDENWVASASRVADDQPGSEGAAALRRLLDTGAAPADLVRVARLAQWELLFHLCYLLADPQIAEGIDMDWGLFQLDASGAPVTRIDGLHESVLDMDPTGREMMVPSSTRSKP